MLGGSAHAIVISNKYTDALQVHRHPTVYINQNTSPDTQIQVQKPKIQVQTPKYKSRHQKGKSRNIGQNVNWNSFWISNQHAVCAGIQYLDSSQPTSQTHAIINKLLVEAWKMQAVCESTGAMAIFRYVTRYVPVCTTYAHHPICGASTLPHSI